MIKDTNIRLQVTINKDLYDELKQKLEKYKFINDSMLINYALADYLEKIKE